MSAATIVFVHGWGTDKDVWQTLQTELKPLPSIALSLPGYGDQCDNTTEWKLDSLAEDLKMRSPANAIWVGWSLGGLLAAATATFYPQHVKALFTIGTTPCFTQRADWDCAMNESTFETFKQSCQENKEECLKQFHKLIAVGANKATSKQARKLICTASSATLLKGLEILENTDLRPAFGKLSCPTHQLFAANDALVPVAVSQEIKSHSNKIDISIINDASHALPLSHSKVIAQHIKARIHAEY